MGLSAGSPKEVEPDAAAFLLTLLSSTESQIDLPLSYIETLKSQADPAAAQQADVEMAAPMIHQCFVIRKTDAIYGIATLSMREGDQCYVIFEAKPPFIVRPINNMNEQYELVGEAYIHGMMEGEAVKCATTGHFGNRLSF